MTLIVCVFPLRQTSAQSVSKNDSESVTVNKSVINDCAKALDELEIYDKLLESKETEIRLLNERLQLEKEKSALLGELADTRKKEASAYLEANNSLKEAIAAKDAQITNLQKEVEILKKKKLTILKILKAVGVGIGIGLILK